MFKKIGLSVFALIATVGIAAAGGLYAQYPQVGNIQNTNNPPGPAYSTTCESFGNNSVCNQFQPFGPTNVPPLAYFPADTGLPGGQNPQTVTVPVTMTGGVVADFAPLTGTSITVPQGVNKVLLDPAGTIAALTVVLPIAAQLLDGQEFSLSSSQTVTTLTITAGVGTSIVATPTTTIGPTTAAVTYIYHAATTKWTNG